MSEENVELLKNVLGAYEGLDFVALVRDTDRDDLRAAFEAVYHPEVEIIWVDTSPDSGPFHGIDEAMRAFEEWFESFEEFYMSTTEFLDAGDEVVVTAVTPGRGKGSGAEVTMTVYWVIAVKDGKIAKLHEYSTKAGALEAAALSGG
jgi:ketosteroid isomerase-like protein